MKNKGRNRTTKSRKIRRLGEKETYKYLGIWDANTIEHAEMKGKIAQKYEKNNRNLTISHESRQRD